MNDNRAANVDCSPYKILKLYAIKLALLLLLLLWFWLVLVMLSKWIKVYLSKSPSLL